MKIFTNRERNEILRYTVETEGVPMGSIISRVGDGVAAEVSGMCDINTHVVVFAGWGLNGAYALAAAKSLIDLGYAPDVYLFNIGGSRLTTECAMARKHLSKSFKDYRINEIVADFDIPQIDARTVVVDGLFGSELERPLPKSFGMVIRSINESGARIVSIEIPSGLLGEWNTGNSDFRDVMHATVTLAVEFPCLSFFMTENLPLIGQWKIIAAGFSREAIRKMPYIYYLITYNDVHRILRQRQPQATKADFGSALICAGSYGMMGAAVLATQGCLRAGAGKVTCYAPRCGYQVLQTSVPSAMYLNAPGESAMGAFDLRGNYDAIGVGPGIGTDDTTIDAFENLLKMMQSQNRPLVIDADALNCIAKRPRLMNYMPEQSVLTPHAAEFDRIFGGISTEEARIRKAIEVAQYHNIIIVLKSRYTAIVRPDGKVHLNSSGTPAMATGGSGDVLTGVITALRAQKYSAETASIVAAFVHGVAGEIAEESHGQYGVTATDIADNIGRAIKSVME